MHLNTLICQPAFHTMYQESERSRVETGGIMLGIPDPPVVVAAGAGGQNAVREAARFSGDVAEDRRQLAEARKRFGPQVSTVGYYHKHPRGMNGFSSIDLRQARDLVNHFGDGKLLLVGIFAEGCPGPRARLFLFGIRDPNGTLKPLDYDVIPDSDPRIREAIDRAPVVPDVKQSAFWNDPGFTFYTNPIGKERIRREVQQLKAQQWEAMVFRHPSDSGLRIAITIVGLTIEAVLPREYPLAPPRVLLKGEGELRGLQCLQEWNSDRSLVEVFRSAIGVCTCAACRRRYLQRT